MAKRVLMVAALALVTGVFALANGYDIFFRLSYLLALLLVGSWFWTKHSVSGLRVDFRGSTTHATVGQRAWEQVTVRNESRLPKLWLELRQQTDLPTPWVPHVFHLSQGRTRTWRTDFLCERRGRFTLGPAEVAGGDPFGLFSKEAIVGGAHSLLVYPATVELTRFSLPPADLPGEGRHRRRTHFVTPNASGVRQYVFGDSYNRIHWPSTARTGNLMVKEFELDPASETWVILDLDHSVQAGEGLQSTEEYAVTAAASIVKHYLDANRPIGFLSYGRYPSIHRPERGSQQLAQVMQTLALVRADGQVPLADLLAGELRRFGRFSTLLVITPSTTEAWVHQLQHLMRRGARVAAVLLEPASFGGDTNTLMTVGALATTHVPTYLVQRGESIQQALNSGEAVLAESGGGRG